MAFTSREIHASAADAFAVLIDPETYPLWLIGTKRIREVDDGWPRPGSRFHHVVGVGPFQLRDESVALDVDHGIMLRLKVKARPFVSAVATFRHLVLRQLRVSSRRTSSWARGTSEA